MSNFTSAIGDLQEQIRTSTGKRRRLKQYLHQDIDDTTREVINDLDAHHARTIALARSTEALLTEAQVLGTHKAA
jgi:hypothetical protein